MKEYLQPTRFLDFDSEIVRTFVSDNLTGEDHRQQAVSLYYAVRDQIRYNPYSYLTGPDGMKASSVLAAKNAFCVPKALLLAACCRAVGIPAAPGFADVRNHLASQKLREMMRSDLFIFHGYTAIWLAGKWVKATPAFNLSLCQKFDVKPLEFDGTKDSLFHPFDNQGRQHMEYVRDHGIRPDLPLEEMLAAWQREYPHWFNGEMAAGTPGNLEKELEEDRRSSQ